MTFSGVPVPGATVTAVQGDQTFVTTTNAQGAYRFADLAEGLWSIRVEMRGFATVTRDVAVSVGAQPSTWALTLLPFAEIARDIPPPSPRVPAAATTASDGTVGQLVSNATGETSTGADGESAGAASAQAQGSAEGDPMGATDSMLINGSVNNGAASPFAQLSAFGNNRRGPRSLYTGNAGLVLGNSAWDARPYSFLSERRPKPDYNNMQVMATFGGPIQIPMMPSRANFFVGYQRTRDNGATTSSARMPTALERLGNFSQTLDASGQPVSVVDPLTGQPFPGGVIPADRISPQAAALLGYYPAPNVNATNRFNYETTILNATRQDGLQTRLSQSLTSRQQVTGTFNYQRGGSDRTTLFGFEDTTDTSNMEAGGVWSYRLSLFNFVRVRYQYERQLNETTPYFAGRENVSGLAGIGGNNQDPLNWGPPALSFSSGLAGLSDGIYGVTRTRTHAIGGQMTSTRGRHSFTFGGDLRRRRIEIVSQQNPRGAFTFTGATTGSDVADFLLGRPQASAIAFGNADKDFRAFSYDAFVTDDWRVSPGLTVNLGVRWEYEAPISERLGRLVNLAIDPGFTAVSPIVANDLDGLTGDRYPTSLVRPDKLGIQPRLGLAWRPLPGSSLVVRAGYGIYRNTDVYRSIALLMAQQPPLSTTLRVQSNPAAPLTLANGFVAVPGVTPNTFAVDPDFRVGFAQNWQVSVQRDMPFSLTMAGTYFGTKGSRLLQQVLPNTYPAGAVNPCPTCPAGFVYLTSNGSSSRHAGQLQVRRRLRNGMTATVEYTLARAMDDATTFSGPSLNGAIAQDWRNLDAEWAPSDFDQRHLLSVQFNYTTGMGVGGGALLDGLAGRLFKGWTLTAQLTTGSGRPLTPVSLTPVAGTGVTGTIRASLTGAALDDVPDGRYLNPDAFATPTSGSWGTAGRNSIAGPAQFSLNLGLGRTFELGGRRSLDWRVDATNLLNRVTYSSVSMLVGSPQFGLPTAANPMRTVRTSLRVRF